MKKIRKHCRNGPARVEAVLVRARVLRAVRQAVENGAASFLAAAAGRLLRRGCLGR